ncbi:MAG TPA: ribosome biogenesis GTPase Der [Acidobacteria bacterium]|nr:ribosome biogenesis GTPase Der [Acidobacteriota bacterium]
MPRHQTVPSGRVALVGRPNVGKSTIFNRLTGTRRAIVTSVAGTTRDVLARPVEWQRRVFTLVDTGGVVGASEDPMWEAVANRGRRAAGAVDLVVFVVDGREGPVPADEEVARELRVRGVPVVVAINKMDDHRARDRVPEFHRFGFEPIVEIAAEHGQGIGDLLDEVVARLPAVPMAAPTIAEEGEAMVEPAIAVVGRPNVGKSSLVNRLLREDRMLVSPIPGTTRDAVDEVMRWHRRRFRLVDTAGIRRPGRVAESGKVETVSVVRARHAMEQADVAVLVVDAVAGVGRRDASIAGEAAGAGCGVIIAANKWDLVKGRGPDFAKEFDDRLREALKFADYAPIVHLSALTGERTERLLALIDEVDAARRRQVTTGELNRVLGHATRTQTPSGVGRGSVQIRYGVQTGIAPPIFTLFTSRGARLHFSYERFIQNRLREAFGFTGTPIRLKVRGR